MYGKMQIMELLDVPWKEIIMDFITKLLKSKDFTTKVFYNSIMVVVDKLTKYIHFIFFQKIFDAEQLKHLFINQNHTISKYSIKYHQWQRQIFYVRILDSINKKNQY